MNITLRKEKKTEEREVENVVREAFWNLFVQGCDEHYLAHVLREHPDFIEELNFIALDDDKIVGNIMYGKSSAISNNGEELNTITFGPVSVLPQYQNLGIGSKLIRHTIELAKQMGVEAVIIEGHPKNYCKHGFKSCIDFNVTNEDGRSPFGLLVLELKNGVFDNKQWIYKPSNVYDLDQKKAEEFDKQFDPKEKKYRPSQEEFSIACRAYVE